VNAPSDKNLLLEQLREAGQSHRLHVTLMFGQMTVFLAAAGGILSQSVNQELPTASARVLSGLGVLVCAVFLVHHERMYDHSFRARASAMDAQAKLGIVVYHHSSSDGSRVPRFLPRAALMSRVLYVSTLLVFAAICILGPAGSAPPSPSQQPNSSAPRTTTQ
jgi:hypothetical protein